MPPTFPSTRWSLIQRAQGELQEPERAALDELCGAYWYPLFAYLRRKGHPAEEAADLVQGLFSSLLERGSLERLESGGGRFRSWLLGALGHHVQDARALQRAAKRGGGRALLALDSEAAEQRYLSEVSDALDAPAQFERAWALEVLRRSRRRLERDYRESHRGLAFDLLSPSLEGEPLDREGAARVLRLSPVALRVALHRLRTRYREHILEEVRDTLGPGEAPGGEASALLSALGGEKKPGAQ